VGESFKLNIKLEKRLPGGFYLCSYREKIFFCVSGLIKLFTSIFIRWFTNVSRCVATNWKMELRLK
jgi:hypothetical protein